MFAPLRELTTRRACCVFLIWVFALAAPLRASDVILYRLFMIDGTSAVSYGEYARMAGTVVFSLPLSGLDSDTPQLQLVSLAESAVDWPRTDAYAEAARARHFIDTRAEAEFSRLSDSVAGTLNQIAFTEDPSARVALADRARRLLADWPARNYGYRANDVAELANMLDEVVSELRVAAGQSRFDVTLVANASLPPSVPLLPPPTTRESVEQAFALSRASQDAAQRSSLLKGITEALAGPAAEGGWAAALRARAMSDLVTSTRTDQAYAALSARMLKAADERVRRADVTGVEGLIRSVLQADDKLGRQRPQETAALLATMDLRLEAARRQRLTLDRWALGVGAMRAYVRKARPSIDALLATRPSLELIRSLAGPSARTLRQVEKSAGLASRELALIKPPADAAEVHGLLQNAFQMAARAIEIRMKAIGTNDMSLAWQASSAAAGALLMLDRARDDIQRLTSPPIK